ncbi:glucoside xylosyltransferase 2 isoform X1 [Carcharodon carcharias]|uniref:glucoside xylosyltransferase 2 isoform X1 n=1 Tax=Carcharodon carcharias TaxID=13397 RepID=UPI001B7E618B|nr:glucoside xylosyltransferase 2 isoform X1 [Carcharodon carcharias]
MKLHYNKLAVIAACLAAGRLLLYLLLGNSAAEPPPRTDQGAALQVAQGVQGRLVTRQPTAFRLLHRPILSQQPRLFTKRRKKPASDRMLNEPLFRLHTWRGEEWMHLAVVACGDRLEETMTMLKSVILFSLNKIKFHIFAEDILQPQFESSIKAWPFSFKSHVDYNIYPITFSTGKPQEWKKLFKPCAAQRLFLPMILKDVDSLLYVDTDVLFLRPVDDVWYFLNLFNSTQLAAMAPEHEIPRIGWYSRFARHPYYGAAGVNSGVMLMNLTRIRNQLFKNSMIPAGLRWEELLYPLYHKYKNDITWGDQDLLNIIFHDNPEYLYVFPCQWNYRPDHCMYGSNCRGAEDQGVSILHGNRGVYHDDKQPAFKAMYEAIRDFPFEDNLFQSLYFPLQNNFLKTVHTLCGRLPQVFLKQIEQAMRKVYELRVIHVG